MKNTLKASIGLGLLAVTNAALAVKFTNGSEDRLKPTEKPLPEKDSHSPITCEQAFEEMMQSTDIVKIKMEVRDGKDSLCSKVYLKNLKSHPDAPITYKTGIYDYNLTLYALILAIVIGIYMKKR